MTLGADITRVSHQSTCDAATLLVDPQLALRALNEVTANSTLTNSTGALAHVLEDVKPSAGDQELGLLQVQVQVFYFSKQHYICTYMIRIQNNDCSDGKQKIIDYRAARYLLHVDSEPVRP